MFLTLFQSESSFYKKLRFEVILIIIATFSIITTLFPTPHQYIGIIILAVVGYFFANIWVQKSTNSIQDVNKRIMINLSELDGAVYKYIATIALSEESRKELYKKYKLNSLYIDANMINFLHSILPLYKYNPEQFFKVLRGTDNILQIRHEIERNGGELINLAEMLEIAIEIRGKSISSLHDFIYTIPKSNQMYTYLHDVIDRYNVLITRNIDIIHHYYKNNLKKNGISSSTKFVSWNTTKAYDPMQNQSIHPQTASPPTMNFYL